MGGPSSRTTSSLPLNHKKTAAFSQEGVHFPVLILGAGDLFSIVLLRESCQVA